MSMLLLVLMCNCALFSCKSIIESTPSSIEYQAKQAHSHPPLVNVDVLNTTPLSFPSTPPTRSRRGTCPTTLGRGSPRFCCCCWCVGSQWAYGGISYTSIQDRPQMEKDTFLIFCPLCGVTKNVLIWSLTCKQILKE